MFVRNSLFVLSAVLCSACSSATDDGGNAANTGTECTESALIDQCPPGSSPILGAQAVAECEQSGGFDVLNGEGAVSGRCASTGSCTLLCQFDIPCPCGVQSITRSEGVVCADCSAQAACGNGVCEGTESVGSCPEDCAGECTPGNQRCNGTGREQCNFNAEWESFACPQNEVCVEVSGQTRCERNDLVRPDAGADVDTDTDTGPVVAGRILFGPGAYADDPGVEVAATDAPLTPLGQFGFTYSCPQFTQSAECNQAVLDYPIFGVRDTRVGSLIPVDEHIRVVRPDTVVDLDLEGSAADPTLEGSAWPSPPTTMELQREWAGAGVLTALDAQGPLARGRDAWLINVDDATVRKLANFGDNYGGLVAISASGRFAATAEWAGEEVRNPSGFPVIDRGDHLMTVHDLEAGTSRNVLPENVTEPRALYLHALAVSPGGQLLAAERSIGIGANRQDIGIDLYNTESGELIYRILPPDRTGSRPCPSGVTLREPEFLPDGDHLVVRSGNCETNSFEVWQTSTGTQVNVFEEPATLFGGIRPWRLSPDGRTIAMIYAAAEVGVVDFFDTFSGERIDSVTVAEEGTAIYSVISLYYRTDGQRLTAAFTGMIPEVAGARAVAATLGVGGGE